ncbi:hypothetical protein AVEN_84799-1, partial [Araneus ventricosus]
VITHRNCHPFFGGCQIVKKGRPPPYLQGHIEEKPSRRNRCPSTEKNSVVRYRLYETTKTVPFHEVSGIKQPKYIGGYLGVLDETVFPPLSKTADLQNRLAELHEVNIVSTTN